MKKTRIINAISALLLGCCGIGHAAPPTAPAMDSLGMELSPEEQTAIAQAMEYGRQIST